MNKARKQWVEALRSGKFTQGNGVLCSIEHSGNMSYCCLGVACEIFSTDLNLEKTSEEASKYLVDKKFDTVLAYNNSPGVLPKIVMQHLEFEAENPVVSDPAGSGRYTIAQLNDTFKLTFNELADVIENNMVIPKHLEAKIEGFAE